MANGRLGVAAPAAATNTSVYTATAAGVAISIMAVNRSSTLDAVCRVAVATSGSPGNTEWIEYDFTIPPNGVFERTGIVMSNAEQVVVYASTANTTWRVNGYDS